MRRASGTEKKKPGGGSISAAGRGQPELVIVTGLSGSGKGTVLKCLEDLGFYSVDHLPIDLLGVFAELTKEAPTIRKAALVIDVREGESLARFPKLFAELKDRISTRLVFLEAADETIMRRFSETRRPHPLGGGDSVKRSIAKEREMMEPIRRLADHQIDTSKFNVHELKAHVERMFEGGHDDALLIHVQSFGFRHGLPPESDLVFDVRFLPNPNYIPEFKNRTGKQAAVARYVRSFPQTVEFLDRISALLIYLIPHYIEEGKSYLTISFGCTGGHHRSVMIAADIRKRLMKAGYQVKETHRDITH